MQNGLCFAYKQADEKKRKKACEALGVPYIRVGDEKLEEPKLTVNEARYWLACEARQMAFAKENGKFWVEPDQVKAWAIVTAAAIRVILREAGLSDDWHLNPDASGEAPSRNAD